MSKFTLIVRTLATVTLLALIPAQQAVACSWRDVAQLYEYDARTQTVLDIEAAMARAQAAHGYIPVSAAEEITDDILAVGSSLRFADELRGAAPPKKAEGGLRRGGK